MADRFKGGEGGAGHGAEHVGGFEIAGATRPSSGYEPTIESLEMVCGTPSSSTTGEMITAGTVAAQAADRADGWFWVMQ